MILPRRFGRKTLKKRWERIIGRHRFVCCCEKSSWGLREVVYGKVGFPINKVDISGGNKHIYRSEAKKERNIS